jgi:hypothetical protein
MPVEISVVQVASLGALVACVLFLLVLLLVGLWVAAKTIGFASRFKSVGAERVNGIVQVKGVFDDASREPLKLQLNPSQITELMKEAVNFDPTPEDLAREAEIERNAAGTGGTPN